MGVGQGQGRDHLTITTSETALCAYEAARHRLPQVRHRGACVRVHTLAEIADGFDIFFLDAFGVLNIGESAIPGVVERIRDLRAMGKRVMVLTNAAGRPRSALERKYSGLGYDFPPNDIISSRSVVLEVVRRAQGRRWGVMATGDARAQELEDLDAAFLEDDAEIYDSVDAFLLLGGAEWTEARQKLLAEALQTRPRDVWVGNPDIVAPRETEFSVEPGYYAHRLADDAGVRPRFFGKPFENIYDVAFDHLGGDVDRSRVLMVGDSLHTDILGAQAAGVASALIADYGFFAGQSVDAAIAKTGIAPDFILDRP